MALSTALWAEADPPPELNQAAALYDKHCASCHGYEGKGDGILGTSLDPRPSNLLAARLKHGNSPQDIFQVIKKGSKGTGMAPWEGLLSDADIHGLVKYVMWLRSQK